MVPFSNLLLPPLCALISKGCLLKVAYRWTPALNFLISSNTEVRQKGSYWSIRWWSQRKEEVHYISLIYLLRGSEIVSCSPPFHCAVELAKTQDEELTEGYTSPRAGVDMKRSQAKWGRKGIMDTSQGKDKCRKFNLRVCIDLFLHWLGWSKKKQVVKEGSGNQTWSLNSLRHINT